MQEVPRIRTAHTGDQQNGGQEVTPVDTKQLFIYTDKQHPKRGHNYGRAFRICRSFKDIRDIEWADTGAAAYLRVGEFMAIQDFVPLRIASPQEHTERIQGIQDQREALAATHRAAERMQGAAEWAARQGKLYEMWVEAERDGFELETEVVEE